jgi:hypothetical protein
MVQSQSGSSLALQVPGSFADAPPSPQTPDGLVGDALKQNAAASAANHAKLGEIGLHDTPLATDVADVGRIMREENMTPEEANFRLTRIAPIVKKYTPIIADAPARLGKLSEAKQSRAAVLAKQEDARKKLEEEFAAERLPYEKAEQSAGRLVAELSEARAEIDRANALFKYKQMYPSDPLKLFAQ